MIKCNSKNCAIILGSGEVFDYCLLKNMLDNFLSENNLSPVEIIACDGGADLAKKIDLIPSTLLGDFDSINTKTFSSYQESGTKILPYPIDKDFSDLEIGCLYAKKLNVDMVILLGVTGSRTDHSLTNIGLMYKLLKENINSYIMSNECVMTLINKNILIENEIGKTVSLIPFKDDVSGIKTEGLKYPLNFETLKFCSTRGVSNIIVSKIVEVTVDAGVLLLILQNNIL